MNSLESFLLDCGFSYTWSKLFPYLFFPLLGLILGLSVRRKIRNKALRVTVVLLLVILPFAGYFVVNPIYEGDFSNNSEKVLMIGELKARKNVRLVVITIPGCPFCMQSVYRMKAFRKRNPNIQIEYRVCSSDPETTKEYQQVAGSDFKVLLAEDPKGMASVAGNTFPAFVLTDGTTGRKWSNDHFGVVALDEIKGKF